MVIINNNNTILLNLRKKILVFCVYYVYITRIRSIRCDFIFILLWTIDIV